MRPLGKISFLALCLALWGLPVGVARAAQSPTPAELAAARRLFEEGRLAEEAGRFRDAAERFRQVTAIKDTPGIRFHLARCEEEQGAFVEALIEYDRARELIDSGVRAPDVERLLPEAREHARAKVAQLIVRLPEGVAGGSVTLDDKPLSASALGVPLPANPGHHRLSASASGRRPFATEIDLSSGETKLVSVELPESTDAKPAPSAAPLRPARAAMPVTPLAHPERGMSSRTAVLITEASLAALGLAGGIGFSVAKSSADERYRQADAAIVESSVNGDPNGAACGGKSPPSACNDLAAARSDSRSDGQLALAGFVASGAFAAAFGLTYWLWTDDADIRAHAWVAPGQATLAVAGRF